MSLLCSIIFTAIEVLHGSYIKALLQLNGVVQLLNERTQPVATTEEILVGDACLRDLRAVIFRFDVEGTLSSARRPLRLNLPSLESKPLPEPYRLPAVQGLDKIEDELTKLMGYMSQLAYNTLSYHYETAGDVPIHLIHEQQQLITSFIHWEENADAALLDLVPSSADATNPIHDTEWTRPGSARRSSVNRKLGPRNGHCLSPLLDCHPLSRRQAPLTGSVDRHCLSNGHVPGRVCGILNKARVGYELNVYLVV